MKWILDDMVLGAIAQVVPPGDLSAWPDGELVIADATAQAAGQDRSGRRQAVLDATSSATGAAIVASFAIAMGSTAGTILYSHLRTERGGTADLAEHESIAWALTDPTRDSVLVTQDKNAALLALAELGRGRVCHAFEFWEHLFSRNHLTQRQFKDLMNVSAKRQQIIPARPWRLQTCS